MFAGKNNKKHATRTRRLLSVVLEGDRRPFDSSPSRRLLGLHRTLALPLAHPLLHGASSAPRSGAARPLSPSYDTSRRARLLAKKEPQPAR